MSWLGTPETSVFLIKTCYFVAYMLVALIVARVALHFGWDDHLKNHDHMPAEVLGLIWPVSLSMITIGIVACVFHRAVRFEWPVERP